jgi:hypothetical protein
MSPTNPNTNVKVNSVTGFSKLVRPKFAPGMLLQHDDLEQINTYTRDLSRLLFRSFFGCGVVCGLCVTSEPKCGRMMVTVAPGLALDCGGDPIHVPNATSLPIDAECNQTLPGPLWVLLCGTTKCCSPRTSTCGCDDDEAPSVCTRERDSFEIRIVTGEQPPACACVFPGDRKQMTAATASPLPPPPPHGQVPPKSTDCQCVDPTDVYYQSHYLAECGCKDEENSEGCCCKCVVLAKLEYKLERWTANHSVRRLIRPVLMRDRGCLEMMATEVGQDTTTTPNATPLVAQPKMAPSVKTLKTTRTRKG